MKQIRILGLALAAFCIVADQLHKWFMLDVLHIAQRPPIELTGFFNLVMVWNEGVSFGLFAGDDGSNALALIIMALGICTALLVWLFRCDDRFIGTALGFVIGGALGNVIDRVRYGAVADFFDFHLNGWHYPAFNIADSVIFIGVCLLFFDSFFRSHKHA